MQKLSRAIEEAEAAGFLWEFYEQGETAHEQSKRTVPGRVVQHLIDSAADHNAAVRTIGLLTSFVAQRSLVCWFLYCTDDQPLRNARHLVEFWLDEEPRVHDFEEAWCIPATPMEGDVAIRDCRWSDTFSASSAVAHAARFARGHQPLDAIISLSHSFIAFDVSPVGDIDQFVKWIVEIAAPCAIESRAMLSQEEFALADFDIPPVMSRRG